MDGNIWDTNVTFPNRQDPQHTFTPSGSKQIPRLIWTDILLGFLPVGSFSNPANVHVFHGDHFLAPLLGLCQFGFSP